MGSLALLDFELFEHNDDDILAVLSRIVSRSSLRTLRTDNWSFMKAFMSQQVDFGIEVLTMPISIADILLVQAFLDKNSNIVDLAIQRLMFDGEYDESHRRLLDLATSSLPRLSRLHGPGCLLVNLVPGRPLHSIEVSLWALDSFRMIGDLQRDEKDILSELKRSSADVTHLQVEELLYTIPTFHCSFPRLQSLSLLIALHPGFPWMSVRVSH